MYKNNLVLQKWQALSLAQRFVIKALGCVVVWKVLYQTWLYPSRIFDKPLTQIVANGTAWMINFLDSKSAILATCSQEIVVRGETFINVMRGNYSLIAIADACNGLELMVMYVGLIVLLPYSNARKWWFAVVGSLLLVVTNVLRCVGLQWVYVHYRAYFETSHHYLFTLAMYVVIFFGWTLYVKKENQVDAKG